MKKNIIIKNISDFEIEIFSENFDPLLILRPGEEIETKYIQKYIQKYIRFGRIEMKKISAYAILGFLELKYETPFTRFEIMEI